MRNIGGQCCPLTSSLGESPGDRDWLWYPGLSSVLVSIAFSPFAFHTWCFPFTLLHLALDFIRASRFGTVVLVLVPDVVVPCRGGARGAREAEISVQLSEPRTSQSNGRERCH